MKRQSLFAVILDSVLAAACAFILIFTLTRFYTHRPVLGLCLGIAAFAAAGALAFLRLNARRGNALQKGRAQKKLAAFEKYTCMLTASGAAELIAAATGGSCTDIEYIALFRPEPLTANELCAATAHESGRRKCVVCNRAGDAAERFAKESGVEVMTAERLYGKLESAGALPELPPVAARTRLADRLKGAVLRSNAGRLMWCGLCLTAFSYFTFYPLYYIISGGIVLMLAAICLVFGKRQ